MKLILKILFISFSVMALQMCKAQEAEYSKFYNTITPKLQNVADTKAEFYNQRFSKFYTVLQHKNINIFMFAYDSKMFNSKDNYILRIYFTDNETRLYTSNNRYQFPIVSIQFKNKIPNEIEKLTKQYHGEWNEEMFKFFSNMEIEKIDFYGINGMKSMNRKAR
ncbi:hypothetical protein [Chryseobacterium sp. JUb7]|uniref:hypothetical protein n=1 Tax=Chryseobacterium sp. JUb7 TaxID=2940599 RepID=UPI002169DDED|nr:hypothetical protein [Chryseobacterium sp. JUb7]MCS3530765.1 hypothetical protein [Chryseobacterium sp. JUb7]